MMMTVGLMYQRTRDMMMTCIGRGHPHQDYSFSLPTPQLTPRSHTPPSSFSTPLLLHSCLAVALTAHLRRLARPSTTQTANWANQCDSTTATLSSCRTSTAPTTMNRDGAGAEGSASRPRERVRPLFPLSPLAAAEVR